MPESWLDQAWREISRLAESGEEFTADDLYEVIDHPDLNHKANARNNMIGQVFRKAHAAGLIEAVGVEQSRQPHRKGGMVRVWRGRKRQRRLVRGKT